MEPERWQRVKDALSAVLKLSPGERPAALDELCVHPSVRREVEDLLESQREMSAGFLETPLFGDVESDERDAAMPPSLEQWSRYQVTARLGRGGMATVYKAWDPRLRRPVAIKVISNRDGLTVTRFIREAEAQARVEHDQVLKIYETGTVGTHHFIAMQFVDGPTLLGVRDETTIEQKVELILQVAEGLHAAHRLGLVHRDIKPGNVLVERTPERLKPYLLDFGLAVEIGASGLTQTGTVMGTPRYMAPERIRGGAAGLDRRSDVYSLGATMYEFIAGEAPFAGTSGLQVLVDVLQREFRPLRAIQPTVAPELDAIVAKCLEKDPRLRYPSARALADDLRRYLNGDAVSARPTGPLGRLARRARRHPRLAAAFAAMAIAMSVLAGWSAYGAWRAARQTALAERLGEDVRDVEWLYRAAQMSPRHAVEPERERVRQRMAGLERIMREAGSIAVGPVRYALGRSRLALGDEAEALTEFEFAWQAGYRTADASLALGLAHARVLSTQLDKAQRIAADAEREARIRELNAAHRDPALAHLEAGRTSGIAPAAYIDALIAAQRGDTTTAIARADAAARETPWLFEARLLQGDLAFMEAQGLSLRGDRPAAGERAAAADRYYAEAERIAPSSVDAYHGRCAVAGIQLHMFAHGLPGDAADALARAEASCARALEVQPGVDGYRLFSEALQYWATWAVPRGGEPGDALDRAAQLSGQALQLSADDVESTLALADVYLNRAWWQSRTERDPLGDIDRAVTLYTRALVIDSRNLSALDNRGQAYVLRGRWERLHALDPIAAMTAAIADFQQELRLFPDLASGHLNLWRIALGRAAEQEKLGIDARPALAELLRFIDGLTGDRALRQRVEAVQQLQARLASPP